MDNNIKIAMVLEAVTISLLLFVQKIFNNLCTNNNANRYAVATGRG